MQIAQLASVSPIACKNVTAQSTVIGPLISGERVLLRYGAAVVLVLGICAIRLALAPVMGGSAPLLPFTLAVIAAGCLGGLCPALLATVLTPLLVTPLFTEWPHGTQTLAWAAHAAFFVVVGTVVSLMIHKLQMSALAQAEALRSVRRSERHLRLLTDHLPALVSYIDREERMRFANAECAIWFGSDSASLLGRSMRAILGAGTYEDRLPYIRRALAGEVVRFEGDTFHHSLGLRACEISYVPDRNTAGIVQGFYAMIQDITDRKRAEAALRESERMLKLIYDHASDGIYLIQIEPDDSFRYLSVNETFLSSTGYLRAHVEGQPIEAVIAATHHALARAKFGDVITTERPIVYDEDTQMPAGRRCMEHTLIPIVTSGVGVTHILGTAKDVTARKQAEEALREADRRKDEFLAMLAHELRNPLAPIRTIAHVLAHETLETAAVRRQGQLLERQVHHLGCLVDDLLDAARITRGTIELKKKMLALKTVLDTAFETVEPLINVKRQTLVADYCAESVVVEGDAARLAQVFGNLLANAAKYSPDRAIVEVSMQREQGDVVVRVRDQGIGIDAQTLPHVFDLFAQADRSLDRSEGGLGIGLTIVKSLIELHGGRVAAHSVGLGSGSTFTVRLPLADGAYTAPATTPAPAKATTRRRVLIVDDNRDAAESLSLLLQIAGHEAQTAHDGASALEALERFRAEVILLDIGLPGVDGYVVAQSIRERFPDPPRRLYALTGYGLEQDRALALSAGFDDHLTKPIDPARLLELIERGAPATQAAGPEPPR